MLQKLAVGVAVAIILIGGLSALSLGFEDSVGGAGDHETVVNESFTVEHGQRIVLAESELEEVVYDRQRNVTVYNQSGAAVAPDGNWSWTRENGTLVVESGAPALADASTAEITYGYREPTPTQRRALEVTRLPMAIGDALMLLFMVATVGGGLLMLSRRT
jgi:hypothetical protein